VIQSELGKETRNEDHGNSAGGDDHRSCVPGFGGGHGAPSSSGEYDLLLGDYGGLHFLNGALDEVKIWDRTLTPDEINSEARR